jgi:hypothetical protein
MDSKDYSLVRDLLLTIDKKQDRLDVQVNVYRQETHARMDHLDGQMDGVKYDMTRLTEEMQRARQENTRELMMLNAKIESGFPNGDMIGHRITHEEYIEAAKKRKDATHSVFKKAMEYCVIGILSLVGLAVWQYFVAAIASS